MSSPLSSRRLHSASASASQYAWTFCDGLAAQHPISGGKNASARQVEVRLRACVGT